MYQNPNIESSYKYNDLGRTLYNKVIELKPYRIIDFGVLNGYSTICLAQGCKDNGFGRVKVYDIFDDYEYNHAKLATLIKNLKEYDLLEWVDIEEKNFFDWVKNPEPFDLLHLDISNTGDILDLVYFHLNGIGEILFEGGSKQRDNVGWMKVHNKKPINKSVAKFEVINSNFPSISRII